MVGTKDTPGSFSQVSMAQAGGRAGNPDLLAPTYSGHQDPRPALDSSRPHRHSDLTACKALPSLHSSLSPLPGPPSFLSSSLSVSVLFSLDLYPLFTSGSLSPSAPGLYPFPVWFLAAYLCACPSFSVYLPPSPTFPTLPLSWSLHPVLGNKCRPRSSHVLGQGLCTWGKRKCCRSQVGRSQCEGVTWRYQNTQSGS